MTLHETRELVMNLEEEISKELADFLWKLMPSLAMHPTWLAPDVGPIKIETPNGIAELIDYEIKPAE